MIQQHQQVPESMELLRVLRVLKYLRVTPKVVTSTDSLSVAVYVVLNSYPTTKQKLTSGEPLLVHLKRQFVKFHKVITWVHLSKIKTLFSKIHSNKPTERTNKNKKRPTKTIDQLNTLFSA